MTNVFKFENKITIERRVARANIQASMTQLPPECELAVKLAELHDKMSANQWNAERGRNV